MAFDLELLSFPIQLMARVNDETDPSLVWTESGKAFVLGVRRRDPKQLQAFLRRLLRYGFSLDAQTTTSGTCDHIIVSHPLFRRDRPKSVRRIHITASHHDPAARRRVTTTLIEDSSSTSQQERQPEPTPCPSSVQSSGSFASGAPQPPLSSETQRRMQMLLRQQVLRRSALQQLWQRQQQQQQQQAIGSVQPVPVVSNVSASS